jgi:CRISPR/Cas system Type II protein with McrA/HNH and RuvC-like nuclease domain
MKKILGLDIGTNSIGWAIIEAEDKKTSTDINTDSDINNHRIGIHQKGDEYAVGSRIIPQEEEQRRFIEGKPLNDPKGSTLTRTAQRRVKRGSRRMKSRYKLRRDKLLLVLDILGMKPEGHFEKTTTADGKIRWTEERSTNEWFTNVANPKVFVDGKTQRMRRPADEDGDTDIGQQLYKLRSKALEDDGVSLQDWGRILLHLNQWRGYSSDRFKKGDGDEKGKGDVLTSLVTRIESAGEYQGKYMLFKISFENGDSGIEVRKKEFSSNFKVGELSSYSMDAEADEIIDLKQLKAKKLDTKSWAYRKKKINAAITDFINETNGTVGSFFYHNFYLQKNIDRIRNNVIDRDWYEAEFDKIWSVQYPLHRPQLEHHSIDDLLDQAFKDENIKREIKSKVGFEAQLKYLIKEKIIYFQRPWQQGKNKGQCSFEKIKVKRNYTNPKTNQREEREEYEGRTVIPRSHPLYQEYKVWQQINNVRLWRHEAGVKTELFALPEQLQRATGKSISEVKQILYEELMQKKSLSWKAFVKDKLHLPLKEGKDGISYEVNFSRKNKKGEWQDNPLKGNTTIIQLRSVLQDVAEDWFYEGHEGTDTKRQARQKSEKALLITNLQLLWEIIYDTTNTKEEKVAEVIQKHFRFDNMVCAALARLKFDDTGMANVSARAIRRLLPMMRDGNEWKQQDVLSYSNWKTSKETAGKIDQLIALNLAENNDRAAFEERLLALKEFIPDKNTRKRLSQFGSIEDFKGLNFWEAAAVVYGQHSKQGVHSSNLTKDRLIERIQPVKHNSMNNPVVEKIVNETLSLVKHIYERYDGFDEVRIELSRELKASMHEREQMWDSMNKSRGRNELAKAMLRELQKPLSGKNLDKVKLFEDVVKELYPDDYKAKAKEWKVYEPSKADIKKYLHWLDQKYQCPYTGEFIRLGEVLTAEYEVDHVIPKERYFDDSYSNKVVTRRAVNDFKGSLTAREFIQTHGGKTVPNAAELRIMSIEAYEAHVNMLFPKGRKRINLLRREIPEDPVARQLKETQYINKRLRDELAKVVGIDKVWTTTGAITDMLRESWHLGERENKVTLNGVMQQLMRSRFELCKYPVGKKNKRHEDEQGSEGGNDTPENAICLIQTVDTATGEAIPEKFIGYSKRLDHRHHALDAIIIACTRQQHIQYINTLNAQFTAKQGDDEEEKKKYSLVRQEICLGDSKTKFKTPWDKDKFIPDVRKALESIVVSHKNAKVLISPSKHRIKKPIRDVPIASIRGELHKETNYARRKYFEPGTKLTLKNAVTRILNAKLDNQQNTRMVRPRTFDELIRQVVLKEKYQDALLPYFQTHETAELNKSTVNKLGKQILKSLQQDALLGKLEWLSVYNEKSSAARPTGLAMDLNNPKEIKDIADPRMKRLAIYRLGYVLAQRVRLESVGMEKPEKDARKAELDTIELFTNGIYEVRVKNDAGYDWVYLPDLNPEQIDRIDYGTSEKQNQKTQMVKQLIQKRLSSVDNDYTQAFSNIVEYPLFLNNEKRISAKKLRQKAFFDKGLYEITPGRFVQSNDSFMLYVFENEETGNREVEFLKFIDAIAIINEQKPEHIVYENLLPAKPGYRLLFTLQKNDLVYWNPSVHQEEVSFKTKNIASLSKHLYVVKDINPSQGKIFIQSHTTADAIKLNEADIKHLLPQAKTKTIDETIKFGSVEMAKQCIKLNVDPLGKSIESCFVKT